jgi:two-component system chemotaxis response regulator CheB
MTMNRNIKVLIVDDSAIVRKTLSSIVESQPDFEVVGTAGDGLIAQDKIARLKPDVVTLDIEMPGMDGLTLLKKVMASHPVPVLVISSLGAASSRVALDAIQSGAVDVIAKPGGVYSVGDLREQLVWKIRAAAQAILRPVLRSIGAKTDHTVAPPRSVEMIGIGSSTGGVEALRSILIPLPENMPPIVIVQHIPATFSAEFASNLDQKSRVRVKEAADGDVLEPGRVFIAPGNFHIRVRRIGGRLRIQTDQGPAVHFQRPAVDVLFESIATEVGGKAAGFILTGMGADGAAGLLSMKRAGARTYAQNEASCVVFGMPREAIRIGAVDDVLPLDRIGSELILYAHRVA